MRKIYFIVFLSVFSLFSCKKEEDPFANYEGMKITNGNGETFVLPTEKFEVSKVTHRIIFGDYNSYDQIELSFFNNKSVPEYKYVKFFVRADADGFNPGVYSGISITGFNSISSFWFADGSYDSDNKLFYKGAGKVVNFEITEIKLSGDKKILKGKLEKAAFYDFFKVWGDDDIKNAEFSVEF